MAFPIPASGLSVVTPALWSLRLFYQLPGGPIGQSVHLNGVWSTDKPTFSTVPLSPLASVTWSNGTEIRVYYLDSGYAVQEFCYTQGKGWFPGGINSLGAKATPLSRLGAIVLDGGLKIRVYYQEAGSHIIKELGYNEGHGWSNGDLAIKDAVEGSAIAAATYNEEIRIYYQTFEELYLKEYCRSNWGPWFLGGFNPGRAPLQTPMSAVAFGTGVVLVLWRNSKGHVANTRWTNQWSPIQVIHEIEPGFNLALLEWEVGKRFRVYCEDFNNLLLEYCSDDAGETWFPGKRLSVTSEA